MEEIIRKEILDLSKELSAMQNEQKNHYDILKDLLASTKGIIAIANDTESNKKAISRVRDFINDELEPKMKKVIDDRLKMETHIKHISTIADERVTKAKKDLVVNIVAWGIPAIATAVGFATQVGWIVW